MNPAVMRATILAIELMVFLIVTAFTAYFISHASALLLAPGDAPPAQFPVIAYDGDRGQPDATRYFVVPWSEWEATATKRPDASLLLPERAASIKIGDAGEATFAVTEEPGSRQAVELRWRTGGGEQEARYIAQARSIEPRYLRTLGTDTFLMSVLAGFIAGLLAGRALRRRWLAQPGTIVPLAPK
jgi:hypothetical protein